MYLKKWIFSVRLNTTSVNLSKKFYLFQELNAPLFEPLPATDKTVNNVEGKEIVIETPEGENATEKSDLPTDTATVGGNAATAVWNTVKDLHLELIVMYHRVSLKLASLGPGNDEILIMVYTALPWPTCSTLL